MYLNWIQLSRVNSFILSRTSSKDSVLELAYKGSGESESCSVVSNSLQPDSSGEPGMQPRDPCLPWLTVKDSPCPPLPCRCPETTTLDLAPKCGRIGAGRVVMGSKCEIGITEIPLCPRVALPISGAKVPLPRWGCT